VSRRCRINRGTSSPETGLSGLADQDDKESTTFFNLCFFLSSFSSLSLSLAIVRTDVKYVTWVLVACYRPFHGSIFGICIATADPVRRLGKPLTSMDRAGVNSQDLIRYWRRDKSEVDNISFIL